MKRCPTLLATLAAIIILAALLSACNTHADNRGAGAKAPAAEQNAETVPETEKTFAEDTAPTQTTPEPDLLTMYREFMNGERIAAHGNYPKSIDMIYVYSDEKEWHSYALFDMNGDGEPELHVRTVRYYYILTYRNSQLEVWRDAGAYSQPRDNGAIFSETLESGQGRKYYAYTVYDFYGNELMRVDFEKYRNSEWLYAEDSLYLFDGVEVTQAQWEALTAKYFAVTSDLITWYIYSEDGLMF